MFRWKFKVILLLVLLTVSLGTLWPEAAVGAPGFVLQSSGKIFVDDFNDGNADGWTPISAANWAVESGEYSGDDGFPDLYIASYAGTPSGGAVSVSDFVMEVQTKIISTYINQFDFTGVFFRSDSTSSTYTNGKGYLALVRANGDMRLYRADGGTAVVLQNVTGTGINPSNWITLRVEAQGNNIKVYVDGTKYIDVNDGTYLSGNIALHPGRVHAHFDDVSIWKSNTITVNQLVEGQKVELYDPSNTLQASDTVGPGETSADLDVSSMSFPFTGYFTVYQPDGITVWDMTPTSSNIWGGDIYDFTPPPSTGFNIYGLTAVGLLAMALGFVVIRKIRIFTN